MRASDALDVLLAPRCAGCRAAGGGQGGPLRAAIRRLKDGDGPGLAGELGALIAGRVAGDLARGVRLDCLVPVLLHPRRARARGYDQARALAAAAAALTGLPLHPAIHRLRSGPAQATLGQRERQENVRGAFAGVAGSLRGLHVGLVDDVATTGATLLDAAAAARACGARDVRAYVVAFEE